MTVYARVMSGRCRTATDGSGQLYHAVTSDSYPSWDRALCGKVPGIRGNGWSEWRAPAVNCPKCLEKMAQLPKEDQGNDRE